MKTIATMVMRGAILPAISSRSRPYRLVGEDGLQDRVPNGFRSLHESFEVAEELANRLVRIFVGDERRRRPAYGGTEKFQSDPNWRDYILFYEHFNGDNGAGLEASHQAGWRDREHIHPTLEAARQQDLPWIRPQGVLL